MSFFFVSFLFLYGSTNQVNLFSGTYVQGHTLYLFILHPLIEEYIKFIFEDIVDIQELVL